MIPSQHELKSSQNQVVNLTRPRVVNLDRPQLLSFNRPPVVNLTGVSSFYQAN
jgi:hypothetical protein